MLCVYGARFNVKTGLCIRPAGSLVADCGSGIPDPWEVHGEFFCTPTYIMTQEDIDAGLVTNNVR